MHTHINTPLKSIYLTTKLHKKVFRLIISVYRILVFNLLTHSNQIPETGQSITPLSIWLQGWL